MRSKLCQVSIKSNSLLSCLSVTTMCLLVFTSVIIITIISITPIIILGLGEINAGQRDVILTPIKGYLNATKIAEFSEQPAMPRHMAMVAIDGETGVAYFMDLELEKQQHLGTLPLNESIQDGQEPVYIHSQFKAKQGDLVTINLIGSGIINSAKLMVEQASKNLNSDTEMLQIMSDLIFLKGIGEPLTAKFRVAGKFDAAMGKFPIGSVGGYAYFNIKTAFQHFVKQTLINNNRTGSKLLQYINNPSNFRAEYFSSQVIINIPNRIQVYSNSDYQQTYNTLSTFGSQILNKIGLFSVTSQIPIASNLVEMSYFGMFIGVILKLIIVSLFVLSILMMNNMMLMGTDQKGFDFALLKTMGASRFFVIFNLLFSSFKYVLISNFIAFPFAYITLSLISNLFVFFFGYSYDVTPTVGAVLGGAFIGILVPIMSSISPIWGIINNDLVQNLNPIRNKTEAIHTQVYIEGAEFPLGKLIFGLISSMFGLMIYYLLPKGLINQDISLLLFVFFSILMGLLLGLILLSYSVQYLFQKFIAYLTLFWANKTDFILTLKNMSAHRFKNRRSSLLYSLSVAFIIFVSVGISIQIQTISEEMLKQHGTYIEIRASSGSLYKPFYDQIFKGEFKNDIEDWAYQTADLLQQMRFSSAQVKKIQFSDKARIFITSMRLYGVSPNYLKVLPTYRMPIAKTYAQIPYDPYEFLYTPQAYMSCIISEYAARKFNLIDSDNRQFIMSIYKKDRVQKIKLNMSTAFSQRAGLSYSRFDFIRQDVAVSFDTYAQLAGLKSYDDLPLRKIKVKVVDPSNTKDLANRLRSKMATKNMDNVWDFSQVKQTIEKIRNLLTNILNILLVLVLLISFFSLVTTSYINIVNQSREIGILLTLGYKKSRIVRIFIYESFVLVLNSCLIGVAVGTFVAWMMGLQRQLFGDFPVSIQIDGIWIIAVAAIMSSLLSIVKPIRQLFSQSINQIFMYS